MEFTDQTDIKENKTYGLLLAVMNYRNQLSYHIESVLSRSKKDPEPDWVDGHLRGLKLCLQKIDEVIIESAGDAFSQIGKQTSPTESCTECGRPGRFIDNCCSDCAHIIKDQISRAIRSACPESLIPGLIDSGAAKLNCEKEHLHGN